MSFEHFPKNALHMPPLGTVLFESAEEMLDYIAYQKEHCAKEYEAWATSHTAFAEYEAARYAAYLQWKGDTI